MGLSRIKLVRLQRGLRQWDVARAAGVTESYLSRLETGRVEPSSELLERLAAVLGVSPQTLRGDVGTGQVDVEGTYQKQHR